MKSRAKIIQPFSSPFPDLCFSQLRTELIFTAIRNNLLLFLLQYFSLEGCFSAFLSKNCFTASSLLPTNLSSPVIYQLSSFVKKIPYRMVTFFLKIIYNTNVNKEHPKHYNYFIVYIFLIYLSREWGWQQGVGFIYSYTTLTEIQNAVVKFDI